MSEPLTDGSNVNIIKWLAYLTNRDPVDGASVTIDQPHHEIHEGSHFTVAVYDGDVDVVAPKIVRITAPDTDARIHLVVFVSADGGFLYEFYEAPTLLVAGSALTEYNNDRNSGTDATATTFEDSTTQAPNNDGTLLDAGYSGGEKKRVSGESGSRDEFILARNISYLVKVTVDADDTKVTVVLKWYEV